MRKNSICMHGDAAQVPYILYITTEMVCLVQTWLILDLAFQFNTDPVISLVGTVPFYLGRPCIGFPSIRPLLIMDLQQICMHSLGLNCVNNADYGNQTDFKLWSAIYMCVCVILQCVAFKTRWVLLYYFSWFDFIILYCTVNWLYCQAQTKCNVLCCLTSQMDLDVTKRWLQ